MPDKKMPFPPAPAGKDKKKKSKAAPAAKGNPFAKMAKGKKAVPGMKSSAVPPMLGV